MGAQVTKLTSIDQRKRSHSVQNDVLLGTLRMIFHNETAQKAFLCFIKEEMNKRHHIKNFFLTMKYFEFFQEMDSSSKLENLVNDIGLHYSSFQNFSDYAHFVQDDLAFSFEFLRQLQGSEQYLMVISVICVLNDFMRSEWHTVWQEVEMQSTEPSPMIFPVVRGNVSDKFKIYDNEIQNFLKMTEVANVSELLISCLKHLPFPLVVMEMNHEKKWFPIKSANTAFEELTGYTEDEVKGLNVKVLNPDPTAVSLMRSEMLEGDVSRVIIPFNRKDGVVLSCIAGVIPIFDADYSITTFVALMDDITAGYCLARLKIFSDLLDAISSDMNILPRHSCDVMNISSLETPRAGSLI